jgi:hypothetical protein
MSSAVGVQRRYWSVLHLNCACGLGIIPFPNEKVCLHRIGARRIDRTSTAHNVLTFNVLTFIRVEADRAEEIAGHRLRARADTPPPFAPTRCSSVLVQARALRTREDGRRWIQPVSPRSLYIVCGQYVIAPARKGREWTEHFGKKGAFSWKNRLLNGEKRFLYYGQSESRRPL